MCPSFALSLYRVLKQVTCLYVSPCAVVHQMHGHHRHHATQVIERLFQLSEYVVNV